MATEKQIQAYIDAQTDKVQVESYHDVVMSKGYVERVAGIVAGALLGITTGMILGVGLGIIPAIAGAETFSWLSVGNGILMGGAVGLTSGSLAGGIYGGSSGSVAVAAEEIERRQKKAALREKLLNDPELQRKADTFIANPQAAPTPDCNTLKDARAQSRSVGEFFKKVFDARVGLMFGILGAIAGAVLGAGLIPGEALSTIPFVAKEGASVVSKIIAGAGVVGLVGVTVGVNYSLLFTSAVNLVKDAASGKFFSSDKTPQQSMTVEQTSVAKAPAQASSIEAEQKQKSFVAKLSEPQTQNQLSL